MRDQHFPALPHGSKFEESFIQRCPADLIPETGVDQKIRLLSADQIGIRILQRIPRKIHLDTIDIIKYFRDHF